ncbi:phosphoribosylamine--glycine ligase [Falsiroseomonas sp. CW058]|uniref:phosphoribosylamine--glycine ligase n=1 Tax=Falsiroseomonas sp. CW058 TaxID=3388664 RepID=UPI003D31BC9A
MIPVARSFLILALLAAAGCGARQPAAPATAEDPAVAACRDEARDSPAVRDLGRRMLIGDISQTERVRAEQRAAEARAFNDCLRRRGLARGGGVEQVQPRGGIF